MKIRMKIDMLGTFHNMEGVRRGDVVNVEPDEEAARYCALDYAEPVGKVAKEAVAEEEKVVKEVVAEKESEGIESVTYENLDIPEHPVSSEALKPDSIVLPDHSVMPKSEKATPAKTARRRAPAGKNG